MPTQRRIVEPFFQRATHQVVRRMAFIRFSMAFVVESERMGACGGLAAGGAGRNLYGFTERGAFYNSFDATRRLPVRNGIPEADIHFHAVSEGFRLGVPEAVDLVISLISWGFH